MNKNNQGPFFEDFFLNQTIIHPTPKTITLGDVALYNGLYGNRFVVQSDQSFAQNIGYLKSPIDDLLLFHIVFGKNRSGYLRQCDRESRICTMCFYQTCISQ